MERITFAHHFLTVLPSSKQQLILVLSFNCADSTNYTYFEVAVCCLGEVKNKTE